MHAKYTWWTQIEGRHNKGFPRANEVRSQGKYFHTLQFISRLLCCSSTEHTQEKEAESRAEQRKDRTKVNTKEKTQLFDFSDGAEKSRRSNF